VLIHLNPLLSPFCYSSHICIYYINQGKLGTDVAKATVFFFSTLRTRQKDLSVKDASLIMEKVNLPLCLFEYHAMKARVATDV
jgi:hypothetical protein